VFLASLGRPQRRPFFWFFREFRGEFPLCARRSPLGEQGVGGVRGRNPWVWTLSGYRQTGGSRPARRGTFLVRPRKVPQRRPPGSLPACGGSPALCRHFGGGQKLASLRHLPASSPKCPLRSGCVTREVTSTLRNSRMNLKKGSPGNCLFRSKPPSGLVCGFRDRCYSIRRHRKVARNSDRGEIFSAERRNRR
jgi:hypothetical protein